MICLLNPWSSSCLWYWNKIGRKCSISDQESVFGRNLHSESSYHPSQLFSIYLNNFLTYWHCFQGFLQWNINLIYLSSVSYLYSDPFSMEKFSVSEHFHAFLSYAGDYINLFLHIIFHTILYRKYQIIVNVYMRNKFHTRLIMVLYFPEKFWSFKYLSNPIFYIYLF